MYGATNDNYTAAVTARSEAVRAPRELSLGLAPRPPPGAPARLRRFVPPLRRTPVGKWGSARLEAAHADSGDELRRRAGAGSGQLRVIQQKACTVMAQIIAEDRAAGFANYMSLLQSASPGT